MSISSVSHDIQLIPVLKMLLKVIFKILIIYACTILTNCTEMIEIDESNAYFSIKSQLNKMRTEQERQGYMLYNITKKLDQFHMDRSIKSYGSNCAEATADSQQSGIYEIVLPSLSKSPFKVSCDAETRGGSWTIILQRMDGSVNFFRNWNVYKNGFGDLDGEFFLGLEKIHALTADKSQELLVLLEDFDGKEAFETYEKFAIADGQELYALQTLGKANGTAGDSLTSQHGQKFSTFDNDNDVYGKNCAFEFTGAWWYAACHLSNLAGKYKDNTFGKGINWQTFRGHEYSLKRAVMMIRPRK